MATSPNQQRTNAPRSGTSAGGTDNTNQPGQYPPGADGGIFGGPLPSGTGAPGTAGARGETDPTMVNGQNDAGVIDGGVTMEQVTNTGAPGTSTRQDAEYGAGSSISFTRPGSYLSGTYQTDTTSDEVNGPGDSTQANDQGYATGGPQLPAIKGNEPQAGSGAYQPGSGKVLRGGRAVRG